MAGYFTDLPNMAVNLYGSGRNGYKDSGTPTSPKAKTFNMFTREINNAVELLGGTLNVAQDNQLGTAIQSYVLGQTSGIQSALNAFQSTVNGELAKIRDDSAMMSLSSHRPMFTSIDDGQQTYSRAIPGNIIVSSVYFLSQGVTDLILVNSSGVQIGFGKLSNERAGMTRGIRASLSKNARSTYIWMDYPATNTTGLEAWSYVSGQLVKGVNLPSFGNGGEVSRCLSPAPVSKEFYLINRNNASNVLNSISMIQVSNTSTGAISHSIFEPTGFSIVYPLMDGVDKKIIMAENGGNSFHAWNGTPARFTPTGLSGMAQCYDVMAVRDTDGTYYFCLAGNNGIYWTTNSPTGFVKDPFVSGAVSGVTYLGKGYIAYGNGTDIFVKKLGQAKIVGRVALPQGQFNGTRNYSYCENPWSSNPCWRLVWDGGITGHAAISGPFFPEMMG